MYGRPRVLADQVPRRYEEKHCRDRLAQSPIAKMQIGLLQPMAMRAVGGKGAIGSLYVLRHSLHPEQPVPGYLEIGRRAGRALDGCLKAVPNTRLEPGRYLPPLFA